jgi:tetratricopeptide (TPR) repeat protein
MKALLQKTKYFLQSNLKSLKKMAFPKPNPDKKPSGEGIQPPKPKIWWAQLQASFATSTKILLAFLFVVILIHSIVELFRYQLVIQPFEMPFDLSRQGYTGTVVAHRLQDYMDKIRKEMQRSSMEKSGSGIAAVQLTELQKRPEIDVPTVGLSLNTTIAQLRRILRINPRRVKGDIVVKGDKLHLSLRITGKPLFETIGDDVKNPEIVIRQAAAHVLKTFEPLIFGLNYCLNNKKAELDTLIKNIQTNYPSQKEKAIAFTLESCLLKRQGKYELALKKLEHAQQLDAENPAIFQMKGDTLLALKQPELAIVEYQLALALDPNNSGVYTQWARALLQMNQTSAAFAKYQEASETIVGNPWIYTDWGYQLATVSKDFADAETKFEQALLVDPSYALTYATWGDVLLQQKQYAEAAKQYETAIEFDPSIAWFYGNWAEALVKQGQYEAALHQYDQAEKLKHDLSWIYRAWGDTLAKLKQVDAALEKYQQAATLEPTSPYYFYVWGNALFDQARYEEAIVQYTQAVKRSSANQPNYMYYYKWGKSLSRLGEYEQAVVQYETALKIKPDYAWSHNQLGYALVQLDKPKQAFNECQTVLALPQVQQNSKTAHEKAASAHAVCGLAKIRLNQPQQAIAECQTALTLNPNSGWTTQCLEMALLQLEQPAELAAYETFIDTLPDESLKARYYYTYARVLNGLKQYQAALIRYQKAADLGLDEASFYGDWGNALLFSEPPKPQEALVKFQQALAKKAKLNWVYGGMGMALAQLGQHEQAISQYKQAIVLNASWVYAELSKTLIHLNQYDEAALQALDLEPTAKLYYELGKALAKQTRYEDAIVQYRKELEIKPTHVWGKIRLAQALTQISQFSEALLLCEQALNSTPSQTTQAGAHAICGLAQIGLKQLETAQESCQTAIQLYQREDWGYWCLGDALVLQENWEEAASQYEQAVNLKPENALYNYKRAQTLVQLEKTEAALTHYQKVVELEQDSELGQQAQTEIEVLTAKMAETPSEEEAPTSEELLPNEENSK